MVAAKAGIILIPALKAGGKVIEYCCKVCHADGNLFLHMAVDPKKVADILNWKAPTDARGIKSFIGLAGYYRQFIEGFLKIAKPMKVLLGNKVEFKWTQKC